MYKTAGGTIAVDMVESIVHTQIVASLQQTGDGEAVAFKHISTQKDRYIHVSFRDDLLGKSDPVVTSHCYSTA